MTRMEIVAGIPVDLQAKATPDIKRLLLEKLKVIFNQRAQINQAAKQARWEAILNDYKKSVDYNDKIAAIDRSRKALEDAQDELFKVGLTEEGHLMDVQQRTIMGKKGYYVFIRNEWMEVTKDQHKRIKDTAKLIENVAGASDPFTADDQLEVRLVMATTVGECMAIINAAADRDVFSITPVQLKLKDESPKKEKKK